MLKGKITNAPSATIAIVLTCAALVGFLAFIFIILSSGRNFSWIVWIGLIAVMMGTIYLLLSISFTYLLFGSLVPYGEFVDEGIIFPGINNSEAIKWEQIEMFSLKYRGYRHSGSPRPVRISFKSKQKFTLFRKFYEYFMGNRSKGYMTYIHFGGDLNALALLEIRERFDKLGSELKSGGNDGPLAALENRTMDLSESYTTHLVLTMIFGFFAVFMPFANNLEEGLDVFLPLVFGIATAFLAWRFIAGAILKLTITNVGLHFKHILHEKEILWKNVILAESEWIHMRRYHYKRLVIHYLANGKLLMEELDLNKTNLSDADVIAIKKGAKLYN